MNKSIEFLTKTIILLVSVVLALSCASDQTRNANRLGKKGNGIVRKERKLIEQYRHGGRGYNPFLIAPKWQVAQLNYLPGLGLDRMSKVEIHRKTDEVFILLKGTAVLIAADKHGHELDFEARLMKPGITYNIPVDTWHCIAMAEDAQVIIVEDANTHLGDVDYYAFSDEQKSIVNSLVAEAIKE